MTHEMSGPDEGWLLRDYTKTRGPAFYSENPHIKFLLTMLVRPILVIAVPFIVFLVWSWLLAQLPKPGNPALYNRLVEQFKTFVANIKLPFNLDQWFQIGTAGFVILVVYFFSRAVYAWLNTTYTIAPEGAIWTKADSWFFFLKGGSTKLDPDTVKGVNIHSKTTIERLIFPKCAGVTIVTTDLEGRSGSLDWLNVRDPERMSRAVDQLRNYTASH